MTQEEINLLLRDLCARTIYDTVVKVEGMIGDVYLASVDWWGEIGVKDYTNTLYPIEDVKPYLRPMSSMTEEEENEYILLSNHCIATSVGFVHIEAQILIDWLDKKMFDHRGLIEKGLALEAPEGMYKTE